MKSNILNQLIISVLLFLSSSAITLAQSTIRGVVSSSADNQPIPGVTIILKGSAGTGTISDIEGNYSLQVPTLEGTLVFSYIGFLTQEVALNGRTTLSVQLQEDAKQLEEVVVVGYGTEKKSDITGAVASANIQEMQRIPLARADETLQGQVAGVRVVNNDASPNGNVSIRIRGVSSINGGSSPLIIIDGVQGANMSDVHPQDIKSIEVLKDASATAIYGSRGAAGVVLITTKKGKREAKPSVAYHGYFTIHTVRKKLDFMTPSQYARYHNTRFSTPPFNEAALARFDAGAGTDWQDAIFRTGTTQNHHLSVSGGTKSTSYSISGDFLDTKGIVINTNYRRFLVRPNLSMNLNEKLKFTLNSLVSLAKDNPVLLNSRGAEGSPVFAATQFPPTKPVFDENGIYSQPNKNGVGPNDEFNPVALATEIIRDNYYNRLILSPSLEYEVIKGLKAYVRVSYQQNDDEKNYYINEKINNKGIDTRAASITNSKWSALQNTNTLTYERTIGKKHYLKFTGLYEQQYITFNTSTANARAILSNATIYNNLEASNTSVKSSSLKNHQALESFMTRLNYAYDGKYILNLTGRWDGASVFAENNKRAFFPAAGLAWNLSEEAFLADVSFLDNLKLRGSYGAVGNAAIQPYNSLRQLTTGLASSFAFGGSTLTNGISLSTQLQNPNLKWETTTQLNVGLDVSLFDNRLSLTADYYRKNTTNLLLRRKTPVASGFRTQLINAGEVENRGVEIALSGSPISKGDFEWNSALIFSTNRNKIIALNSGQKEIPLGAGGLPGLTNTYWLEVGQPIGLMRGYRYAGVWKSNEAALAAAYNATPGGSKIVDQNNDGIINQSDVVNIAHALPDFTYSWNNSLKYKSIGLNLLIVGVQGNSTYNISRLRLEDFQRGVSAALLNRWTPQNENTNVPGNDSGGRRNSSRWAEDGSYLRIKNITLSYQLPQGWLDKLGIGSANVYATGTNLFTFTKYSGFDPESNNASDRAKEDPKDRFSTDAFAGIDLASYPSQKKYTIGLNITF